MSRNNNNNNKGRYQRLPSIILISDDDDDDDDENDNSNKNNHPIQTQYATPMAQIDEHSQIDAKPIVSTTVRRRPSFLPVQRQQLTTVTSITTESREIVLTPTRKSPYGLAQRDYLPYTLTSLNQERLSILPTYPPLDTNDNDNDDDDDDDDDNDIHVHQPVLLLVNIPINQLSQQELTRREQGQYKPKFSILKNNAFKTSFMVQQYKIYYGSIIERFNIDTSLLDYNYIRLKQFIQLCQLAYIRTLPVSRSTEIDFRLNENEFPQLLEFYLQIDVDLFYMKTCSFRRAEPRIQNEGIFCTTTPECRYVMEPCGRCSLCISLNQATNRQQYSVSFNLYQKHRFVNGYESILNSPASCNTNNIIYVLTCQCGNYDYIGETSGTLLSRLSSHQLFTHRLILENLLGEKNYVRFWGAQCHNTTKKDRMRLYQHTMHCSSVVQSFLNQNMDYWIFVPMLNEEVNQENMHSQSVTIVPSTTSVQTYFDDLPKPPNGYKFSKFQIAKQYEFFTMKHYKTQPNTQYVVFNTTMISVLPLNTSDLFRRLIHALLVTHAETKLNTLGHLFKYPLNAPIYQGIWCSNLRRRPPPPPQPSRLCPKY